jgi:hypothetical protein
LVKKSQRKNLPENLSISLEGKKADAGQKATYLKALSGSVCTVA